MSDEHLDAGAQERLHDAKLLLFYLFHIDFGLNKWSGCLGTHQIGSQVLFPQQPSFKNELPMSITVRLSEGPCFVSLHQSCVQSFGLPCTIQLCHSWSHLPLRPKAGLVQGVMINQWGCGK